MENTISEQWRAVGDAAAILAHIQYGNVTFRVQEGRFTGLVEIRETLKIEEKQSNDT